uniref:hypothetical protein n=1 Tax=Photobacterium phosphoreum TaxID=659 RepID=UPI0024B666E4
MAYYWVNLGVSYKEVRDFKFLWAPSHTYTASGEKTVKAGWGHVPNIKKDDVIICHENKRIIYVAQALDDAYPAPRPESRTYDEWKKEGNKVTSTLLYWSAQFQPMSLMDRNLKDFYPLSTGRDK